MLRYAITDRVGDFEQVDFVQLRAKELPAGELATLARTLLEGSAKLLINGRADVAVAVGAHGVHLTSSPDELKPKQIRALYARAGLDEPVITVSCHTLEDVVRQRLDPVSAILFGPVFEKVVAGRKVADGVGLEALREACLAAGPVPVLALGGVTAGNIAACIAAGAGGVAGIRLFEKFLKRVKINDLHLQNGQK